MRHIILDAFTWAFAFFASKQILNLIGKIVYRNVFKKRIEQAQRDLQVLEEIEDKIMYECDVIKLTVAEIKIDKIKERYKRNRKQSLNSQNK